MRERSITFLSIIVPLLLVVGFQSSRFSHFRKIEAYEVRSGILMFPTYTDDGQLCKIGLERWHYSPKVVTTDSGVSEETFDEIVNELVPENERGPRTDFEGADNIWFDGNGRLEIKDYEKVMITYYGSLRPGNEGYVAATIIWLQRKCR